MSILRILARCRQGCVLATLGMLVSMLATDRLHADEKQSPRFRIAVEVSVSDEDLRERVAMYIRNELRRLGDVEVTPDDPDFKIYAMVMEMKTSANERIAYILGLSIASFFPDGYFDSILREDLMNSGEVAQKLESLTVYENQFLSLAGPTEANLIEVVTNSISKLDAHILSPERPAE